MNYYFYKAVNIDELIDGIVEAEDQQQRTNLTARNQGSAVKKPVR